MADTEEVIGQTEDNRSIVYFEHTGPNSYSQADNYTISINSLTQVERVMELDNDAGYRASEGEASLSGSDITAILRYYGYACPGASGTEVCSTGFEVVDGRDLSNVTFTGLVVGH